MTEEAPELVLSAERLAVGGVARHPAERVLLHRRVVSEVQQVSVTVRREELVVERVPFDAAGARDDDPEHAHEPLVLVLSREVPQVQMRVEPYERVTVTVHEATRQQVLTAPVRSEQVELVVDDADGRTTGL